MDPAMLGLIICVLLVCSVLAGVGIFFATKKETVVTVGAAPGVAVQSLSVSAGTTTTPASVNIVVTPFAEGKKTKGGFLLSSAQRIAKKMGVEPNAGTKNPSWKYKDSKTWEKEKCKEDWSLFDDKEQLLVGNVSKYSMINSDKEWCALELADDFKADKGGLNSIQGRPAEGDFYNNPKASTKCLENWNYYNDKGELVYGNIPRELRVGIDETKWWCPRDIAEQYSVEDQKKDKKKSKK